MLAVPLAIPALMPALRRPLREAPGRAGCRPVPRNPRRPPATSACATFSPRPCDGWTRSALAAPAKSKSPLATAGCCRHPRNHLRWAATSACAASAPEPPCGWTQSTPTAPRSTRGAGARRSVAAAVAARRSGRWRAAGGRPAAASMCRPRRCCLTASTVASAMRSTSCLPARAWPRADPTPRSTCTVARCFWTRHGTATVPAAAPAPALAPSRPRPAPRPPRAPRAPWRPKPRRQPCLKARAP
mmetsp:Transcript_105984/g.304577  ORF Transcript_105984/g.304577 Transcript_105984/m.304577 type:complete len:244 (+) Transcript_105984:290-1021(+)